MIQILKQNADWVFSGIGCSIICFFIGILREKTKWINTDNEYFVMQKRNKQYGYIVPDNYHPISSRQYHSLIYTRKITTLEKEKIFRNIDGKTIVWKIRINDVKVENFKDNQYVVLHGVISKFGNNHGINIRLSENKTENIESIKCQRTAYIKGRLQSAGGFVVDAEILSIRNSLFRKRYE